MCLSRNRVSTLTHRAAHATWWSAIEIAARYGVQIIVLVVLARLLKPADFGLIAMLLVFTTVAGILVDGGFGTALIQRQNTTANDETTVFVTSLGTAVVLAAILWLLAPSIADFYSQPELTRLTRLVLFVLPLSALAAVPDALLIQRLNFRARANAEVVSSLCSGIIAVALAWHGFGVWSLGWQAVTAISLRGMLLWLLSGWRPRGRFDTTSFRSLFGFGGYMLLSNLLNMVSMRLQSLVIGRMFSANVLGYYTMAQNTRDAPTQFVSGLLNRVGLPVFASVAGQPAKLAGALQISLRVACFVFVPCMFGIAVVAKPLIAMLYGASWAPSAPLLSILAIAAALWPLHVLNLAAISARGRADLVFRLEVTKQVLSIPLVVASSFVSVMAVAWAVLASGVISVVINTWYSRKLVGYGMFAQLRDQAPTLLLSAIAASMAWLASRWFADGAIALGVAIVAATTTYFAAAALGRVAAWREMMDILRTLRASVPIADGNA